MDDENSSGKHPGGRPPVIDKIKKSQILAVVSIGGSLQDAADIAGVARSALSHGYLEQYHPEFLEEIRKARALGKQKMLHKILTAKEWTAAAWWLERLHHKEFGRRLAIVETDDAPIDLTPPESGG